MKTNSYELCNTRVTYDYEAYKDYCYNNGIEPGDKYSNEYYGWLNDAHNREWCDFVENLSCSESNLTPVIITGQVGLWDGTHDVYSIRCDTILDAVKKCFSTCDDIHVSMDNGVIKVSAYHHDGTNTFEIHKLSSKGLKATSKWENLKQYKIAPKGYWFAKFHGYIF